MVGEWGFTVELMDISLSHYQYVVLDKEKRKVIAGGFRTTVHSMS